MTSLSLDENRSLHATHLDEALIKSHGLIYGKPKLYKFKKNPIRITHLVNYIG